MIWYATGSANATVRLCALQKGSGHAGIAGSGNRGAPCVRSAGLPPGRGAGAAVQQPASSEFAPGTAGGRAGGGGGTSRQAALLDLDPSAAVDTALRAATGLRLAIHLRMTGRVRTVEAACPPGPYTRCVFALRTPVGEARQLFLTTCGPLAWCWPPRRIFWPAGHSGEIWGQSRWT